MTTHVVVQGEHLAAIARRHGFGNPRAIWDHPENAKLRRLRDNPNVLLPGDTLFVPARQAGGEACRTEAIHRFRLARPALQLRIVLRDFDGRPLAHCPCVLQLEGKRLELESDGKGLLEVAIRDDVQHGTLSVPDLGMEVPVRIGHLDPVDSDTGWRARLVNLGYHPGAIDADEALLRRALEEFQCDRGLPATGSLDAATRAQLKLAHGC